MNLSKIANEGGFGSGKRARDMLHAKADRRNQIPARAKMAELIVGHQPDALVASLGYDAEDGKDYYLNSDDYCLIGNEGPLAGQDARAIAALWNAYRDGELEWKAK